MVVAVISLLAHNLPVELDEWNTMSAAQGWSPDKFLNPNAGTVGVAVATTLAADGPCFIWTVIQGGLDPDGLPPILEGART